MGEIRTAIVRNRPVHQHFVEEKELLIIQYVELPANVKQYIESEIDNINPADILEQIILHIPHVYQVIADTQEGLAWYIAQVEILRRYLHGLYKQCTMER